MTTCTASSIVIAYSGQLATASRALSSSSGGTVRRRSRRPGRSRRRRTARAPAHSTGCGPDTSRVDAHSHERTLRRTLEPSVRPSGLPRASVPRREFVSSSCWSTDDAEDQSGGVTHHRPDGVALRRRSAPSASSRATSAATSDRVDVEVDPGRSVAEALDEQPHRRSGARRPRTPGTARGSGGPARARPPRTPAPRRGPRQARRSRVARLRCGAPSSDCGVPTGPPS